VFERFTDRARRTIVLAQEESRLLGHDYIGTEHLLLGLLHEGEGFAAKALDSLDVSLVAVRAQVEQIIGPRPHAPAGHIPFTPRAKKVLELSLREALQLGHNYIGTEHILLGLLREGEGLAAQILVTLGADLRRVREQVLGLLAEPESISARRTDYDTAGLERADLAADPITQFIRWFDDASNAGLEEPHAMTLATTTPDRRPNARMVLLRGVDERGFVWFTNRNSRKGRELDVTPFATLVFAWIPLHRQIRVDGEVTIIDDAESDAYFATRPRAAQIGAWASQQSEVLDDRATLDAAVAAIEERFGEDPIPRPPHWGGYRLAHETLEVWQGRANRLHDRFRYRQELGGWLIERLWP
jgi:pyridoxamine 5'-phosphate oxidase